MSIKQFAFVNLAGYSQNEEITFESLLNFY